MDQLMEQIEIIASGIRWQLIIVVLVAAVITEQVKRLPWIEDAENAEEPTQSQRMSVWMINALLPEIICINACLFIPTVLPEDIDPVVAIFIGYLSGTLSSKVHSLVLRRFSKMLPKITFGKEED